MYQYSILVLILGCSTVIWAHVIHGNECYSNETDHYLKFATKTSYFNADNENDEPIQIEGKYIFELFFELFKFLKTEKIS